MLWLAYSTYSMASTTLSSKSARLGGLFCTRSRQSYLSCQTFWWCTWSTGNLTSPSQRLSTMMKISNKRHNHNFPALASQSRTTKKVSLKNKKTSLSPMMTHLLASSSSMTRQRSTKRSEIGKHFAQTIAASLAHRWSSQKTLKKMLPLILIWRRSSVDKPKLLRIEAAV
jgi:hypothetical protein